MLFDNDDDDDGGGDGGAVEARSFADVDLNCRENVSLNSDSDEHYDGDTIENKVFPQQRFSPVTSALRPAALRPRPIKLRTTTDMSQMTGTSAVRPSTSMTPFQPHGEVFKARATLSDNSPGKLRVFKITNVI